MKTKNNHILKPLIMKFLHVLICLAIFSCNLTYCESEIILRNKFYNEKFGSKTKYLITNGIKMTHRLFYAKLRSDYFQFCGATILHEHFVITAGHCVYHLEPHQLVLVVGDFSNATSGRDIYSIEEIYTPNNFFVWKVPMNDIALVRTTVPIRKAFDFALPICSRKTAPEDLRGVILAAVGMGSILPPSQEPEYPAELQ
ncbi:chymotrypsin-1-like, partial [Convolutriloba macropyga]|uniref:chymotrypsin-1-like n=1 Tax=Convolutriloba macropyga TaxID=536237 RepID=UPI003F51E828